MPLTVPDELPIVAIAVLPLVHVPPPVKLESISDDPVHTVDDNGVIAAGAEMTVTILTDEQLPML